VSWRGEYLRDGAGVHVSARHLGGRRWHVQVGEHGYDVEAERLAAGALRLWLEGRQCLVFHAESGNQRQVRVDGATWSLEPAAGRARGAHDANSGIVDAPMAGTVLQVLCRVGEHVDAGRTLVVLTAMKMEHRLSAGVAGKVVELPAQEGAAVEQGKLLVRVEPAAE
jgi:3-methylcrotonyl-CoA carboxylase alpha subunit